MVISGSLYRNLFAEKKSERCFSGRTYLEASRSFLESIINGRTSGMIQARRPSKRVLSRSMSGEPFISHRNVNFLVDACLHIKVFKLDHTYFRLRTMEAPGFARTIGYMHRFGLRDNYRSSSRSGFDIYFYNKNQSVAGVDLKHDYLNRLRN
jgi:hypothetical protein